MQQMRMEPVPQCPVCGGNGEIAFTGMIDHMLNVGGAYTLRRCNDPTCATLWMDPRPVETDIHLAYSEYYTHTQEAGSGGSTRGALKKMRTSIDRIVGLQQQRERHFAMYLGEGNNRLLLDVGCGSCLRLEKLRSMGWRVTGQDVDPAVQKVADARQIPVFIGPLAEANFAEGMFDAVVSSHAIEHMHDPRAALRECLRILKPGGVLVFVTPNGRSASIGRFGGDWAGLDSPRHLVLFTTDSLAEIARQAGFAKVETWSTNARTSVFSSLSDYFQQVAKNGGREGVRRNTPPVVVREVSRQYWKTLTESDAGATGDECVLRAVR